MNNVSKTIGWADYTWNPVVGCKRGCLYCYARKIHNRFNPSIPFDKITVYDERLEQPLKIKKPSRIFVGSMSDIEYWNKLQMLNVLDIIKLCPQHIFIFLTKHPYIYKNYEFSKNCWLGYSAIGGFLPVGFKSDNIKFISIEPLLERTTLLLRGDYITNWIIIGGLTPKPKHKKVWVESIIRQAKTRNIPIFMKSNLKPIWEGKLIQEFPKKSKGD